MTTQVQELISKIKTEGIQAAEDRAREIEESARKKADDMIRGAEQKAEQIRGGAERDSAKTRESTQMALQQAARNMLLSLRKDIEQMLKAIVSVDVKKALSGEELARIIENTIKEYLAGQKEGADVTVTVSPADLKSLKHGFIEKLQKRFKNNEIRFKSAEDMTAGFAVSFDSAKSSFDFSDESLADYLSGHVNAEIAALLKESLSTKK